MARYAGSQVLVWTDNQSVLYAINKAKAHVSNRELLIQLFMFTATYDITLKAVYIPTKLNTTADLLSRHVFSALASDYAICRFTFVAIGGFRCDTVAFADPRGRTAQYLLGGKKNRSPPLYYSSVRSVFLHAKDLAGRAVWFNPPFALVEQALQFFVHVYYLSPHRTYLLGIVPYLPHRSWFAKLVGPGKLFAIKKLFVPGAHINVRTRACLFVNTPYHALPTLPSAPILANPI